MGLMSEVILRKGSWWIRSKSDPRWNCNGESAAVGGLVVPEEAKKAKSLLKEKLGEEPADLEWGYMKY